MKWFFFCIVTQVSRRDFRYRATPKCQCIACYLAKVELSARHEDGGGDVQFARRRDWERTQHRSVTAMDDEHMLCKLAVNGQRSIIMTSCKNKLSQDYDVNLNTLQHRDWVSHNKLSIIHCKKCSKFKKKLNILP